MMCSAEMFIYIAQLQRSPFFNTLLERHNIFYIQLTGIYHVMSLWSSSRFYILLDTTHLYLQYSSILSLRSPSCIKQYSAKYHKLQSKKCLGGSFEDKWRKSPFCFSQSQNFPKILKLLYFLSTRYTEASTMPFHKHLPMNQKIMGFFWVCSLNLSCLFWRLTSAFFSLCFLNHNFSNMIENGPETTSSQFPGIFICILSSPMDLHMSSWPN